MTDPIEQGIGPVLLGHPSQKLKQLGVRSGVSVGEVLDEFALPAVFSDWHFAAYGDPLQSVSAGQVQMKPATRAEGLNINDVL